MKSDNILNNTLKKTVELQKDFKELKDSCENETLSILDNLLNNNNNKKHSKMVLQYTRSISRENQINQAFWHLQTAINLLDNADKEVDRQNAGIQY